MRAAAIFLLAIALPARAAGADRWVEKTLRGMSVDEKIGQLLVPMAIGGFRNQESEEFAKIRRNVAEYHVGGYNVALGDPAAAALMIHSMQRIARVPLLITGDLEGGAGYVFPGATRLPLGMAIGATGDPSLAREAGRIAAREGRALGFHVNYYPVADVNNNPANPIINIRSFGENPERVAAMVSAYVRGCQEEGMLCVAKHFPGHGDVATDSHLEMPVVAADRARLDRVELPPFRAAIAAGVGGIMTAHIALPAIDPDTSLPATLSRNAVTSLLREELEFQGLIFTDALDMKGVLGKFGEGEVAVRAIEAGADVLVFANPETMVPAIRAAVDSGRLPIARIEASVRRILAAKARVRLDRQRLVALDRLDTAVGGRAHREVAQQIMNRAITLVRNDNTAIPMRASADLRLLHLTVLDRATGWINDLTPGPVFAAELKKRFPLMTAMRIDDQSAPGEIELVRKAAGLADAVVVGTFVLTRWAKGTIELPPQQVALIRQLAQLKKPFVLVAFGSPYVLRALPGTPSYVAAYDTHAEAQRAAAAAIVGEIEPRGMPPIRFEP